MNKINSLPYVSVVIPARNESAYIEQNLAALTGQSYPRGLYEIIVVDNGSTDKTLQIAEAFPVKIVDGSGLKVGGVRNLGVSKIDVKCEIIAFIDADCVPPKDWLLESILVLLKDNTVGAVGGYFRLPKNSTWLQYGWAPPIIEHEIFVKTLATGSFFIRKITFYNIGPFNPHIDSGEDMELSSNIARSGLKLVRSPCSSVYHLDYPYTVPRFLARQIHQSKNYFNAKRKGFDLMLFGVSCFLVFFILSIILCLAHNWVLLFISVLGGVSCITTLTIKKIATVIPKKKLSYLPSVLVTTSLYLIARSLGLSLAILNYILRVKESNRN